MEHLNKVIKMLTQGEIPISCIPIRNGDENLAQTYGDADIDMVIFEMEHQSFTFDGLQSSLQHLLNRQRIAEDGLMPSVTPVVRIPTSGSEVNEWMIKQALDQGVYGIVVPRLESGEQVRKTVEAMRYPARRGSSLGGGRRGYSPFICARYWGLSVSEYVQRADLWPIDPEGDLILIGIIESRRGVENIGDILDAEGLGAIMIGLGDLSAEAGVMGNGFDPLVVEWAECVKEACKKHRIPVIGSVTTPELAGGLSPEEQLLREYEKGTRIVNTWPTFDPALTKAVRAFSASIAKEGGIGK